MRSKRHNQGVPAARYDIFKAVLEAAEPPVQKLHFSDGCAQSSVQSSGRSVSLKVVERDYLAEVDHVTGDDVFEAACATLVHYRELLTAEGQQYQRSAPVTPKKALSG